MLQPNGTPASATHAGSIESACPKCSDPGPHAVTEGVGPHRARITCSACGAFWWLKKDQQPKRVDRNAEHRHRWKTSRDDNVLVCHWCLAREDETTAWFEIDHILPLERGGADEFRNTRPLCADCHTIRHALERHSRHARGLSARESAA